MKTERHNIRCQSSWLRQTWLEQNQSVLRNSIKKKVNILILETITIELKICLKKKVISFCTLLYLHINMYFPLNLQVNYMHTTVFLCLPGIENYLRIKIRKNRETKYSLSIHQTPKPVISTFFRAKMAYFLKFLKNARTLNSEKYTTEIKGFLQRNCFVPPCFYICI